MVNCTEVSIKAIVCSPIHGVALDTSISVVQLLELLLV